MIAIDREAIDRETQEPAHTPGELPANAGDVPDRAGDNSVPGDEMPGSVYVSVFAGFGWIVLASWLAFARGADADLALGFAAVLTIVFFALPVLVYLTAKHHVSGRPKDRGDFLSSPVETATGALTGANAWLEVVLIPAALALAATLIGATAVLVR